MRSLVVTRPEPQATAWVQALREHGVDAHGLPLIEILPAPDPAAVGAAWAALAARAEPAAMFVSPNAVHAFFEARPASIAWPPSARALATGPGTVAALREWGVAEDRVTAPPADAPRFDSEALWAACADQGWTGRDVWIVRGQGGRDWFASTLAAQGARVHPVAAYVRGAPGWSDEARALCARALAAPAGWAWHFSSSEAIGRLAAARGGASLGDAVALATHPRIAESARAAGFGCVVPVGVSVDAAAQALGALD